MRTKQLSVQRSVYRVIYAGFTYLGISRDPQGINQAVVTYGIFLYVFHTILMLESPNSPGLLLHLELRVC